MLINSIRVANLSMNLWNGSSNFCNLCGSDWTTDGNVDTLNSCVTNLSTNFWNVSSKFWNLSGSYWTMEGYVDTLNSCVTDLSRNFWRSVQIPGKITGKQKGTLIVLIHVQQILAQVIGQQRVMLRLWTLVWQTFVEISGMSVQISGMIVVIIGQRKGMLIHSIFG